jgi:hypothetical protein
VSLPPIPPDSTAKINSGNIFGFQDLEERGNSAAVELRMLICAIEPIVPVVT